MKQQKSTNLFYNKKLRNFAHSNRYNMTKAEACLWKYVLRSRQVKGYRFTRQRSVLNYIADFMCKSLKLVIEVDGITHLSPEVIQKDIKKQTDLEREGFVVLRFVDGDVLCNIDWVKNEIERVVEEIEKVNPCRPSAATQ